MKVGTSRAHAEIERVYRDVGPRLWRALYAYSGSREVADEARAEAFAQALRRGSALREPERWIWRSAFRIAAGQMKAASEPVPTAPRPEVSDEDGAAAALLAGLRRLSPMQRGALVLRYYAGYSSAEAARMLGTSAAAVRVHATRGRRRLRELLKEEPDA